MKQFEQTIDFSEAKEMLQISQNRSLLKFINESGIKIITKAESGLSEILLDQEDFIKALKVEKLPEKFLTISEAAKVLELSEARILTLCRKGELPFYRLCNEKGGKLLFIESELTSNNENLSLDKSDTFYVKAWKYEIYERFFLSTLYQLKDEIMSLRESAIIDEVFTNNKSLEQIAEEYSLTIERTKHVFNMGIKDFCGCINFLKEKNENITQKYEKLLADNAFLRQELRETGKEVGDINAPVTFSTGITHLGLSVRALNCLKAADIETLGELVNSSVYDLSRFRNFGKKSLDEIIEKLAEHGLQLKDN